MMRTFLCSDTFTLLNWFRIHGRQSVLLLLALAITAGRARPAAAQTAAADGWVALPVDEYRALRDRAIARPPALQGTAVTISRIDYELTVDAETAAGRALLTIDVLRDGWIRVPIPAGLLARDARLDGQPVALIPGTPPQIALSRAGRVVVALDIALPVTTSTGAASIALPAGSAPVSRVVLTLPKNDVDLSAGDGFIDGRADTSSTSQWTVFARPQQPLTLQWKRRQDDRRAELPLRVRARVNQLIGLGEESAQETAAVRLEVIQGVAPTAVLSVPQGVTVTQVDGPMVGDWTVTGETLTVCFLDPLTADASFVVHAEGRMPREGLIALPLFRVPSAERETGAVGVEIVGAGELVQRQTRNFDPADASELGDLAAGRISPSMVAFRARPTAGRDPRALSVNVVRYTPQAVLVANVEDAVYRALVSEDGEQLVEAEYWIRNNQHSFLKVTLPPDATLWSAMVANRPVRPGIAPTGALLLPLDKSRGGEEAPAFPVTLVYLQKVENWAGKGGTRITFPTLDLPVSRTGVELRHSPRYRVTLVPGGFRAADDLGLPLHRMPAPAAGPLNPPGPDIAPTARSMQLLVDRFRNESGGRTVAGSLPVSVSLPSFGSVAYFRSELTAESQEASIALTFKRVSK